VKIVLWGTKLLISLRSLTENGETVKSSLSDEGKLVTAVVFRGIKNSEKQFGSLKLNFYLCTPLRNEGLPERVVKEEKFFRYCGFEAVKKVVDLE
jgi:hypothetical protein